MGDISKNFNRSEFACKCGCGFDAVDKELVCVLELVRKNFNAPVIINSACRCLEHNRSVGSKDTSQHVKAKAADIVVKGVKPQFVYDYLNDIFSDKYGIGNYKTFTHIDVRDKKARW
jgi:uncharacterized protein YcbK (DUF882 family)